MEEFDLTTELPPVDLGPVEEFVDYMESLKAQIPNHPDRLLCDDWECIICALRDCPFGEPLHYHHDGCPACLAHDEPETVVYIPGCIC